LKLRLKPLIDALGVKEMKADRNLADGDALLEFLEADHTFCLLELVDVLIIRALSDQYYQRIDYMYLVQHPPPYLLSDLYLVVLELLLKLHSPNAHHDDGSDADEFETETEN
jgi:hypothetical protein